MRVTQAVPLFGVSDMQASLHFYVDGLGFELKKSWTPIALYHQFRARGIAAARPFVGNGLWVTSVVDPDGYKVEFESPTDVAEDTEYSEPPAPPST